MGFISAHASTPNLTEGETRTIQEWINMDITPDSTRDPMIIAAYYFWYDSDLSALVIGTPAWPYPFYAVLQNLTTGESYFYTYEEIIESGNRCIPFTGGEGIWRLSLCSAVPHNPRILVEWYFTIEDGEIIR